MDLGIAQFFISIGVTPAAWNHATGRMFGDQVAQVRRVSCFHGRLFDPMFSSVPVGLPITVSCIRLQVHETELFPNPHFSRSNLGHSRNEDPELSRKTVR